MSAGNGATPNLHLTGQETIIGQPQFLGATVLGVFKCPCGAHPITLVSQCIAGQWASIQVACILCHTPYAIANVGADPSGALTFNLAIGAKPSGLA